MQIPLIAPALLFPALTMLLLVYANRFTTVAVVTRQISDRLHKDGRPNQNLFEQLVNLRIRIRLIRWMQCVDVVALILNICALALLFLDQPTLGHWAFAGCLLALAISLGVYLAEILLSGRALDVELSDMEQFCQK